MPEQEVQELVFRALENAVKNGYGDDMRYQGVEAIAYDLLIFDSELEHMTLGMLAPHIREFRKQKGWA